MISESVSAGQSRRILSFCGVKHVSFFLGALEADKDKGRAKHVHIKPWPVDMQDVHRSFHTAATVCLQMHEEVTYIIHTEGLWLYAHLMYATPCSALARGRLLSSVYLSESVV